ncbi:L-threonine dehydratase catabolic TdcB [Mycetomoellerius zeteki]|uniref:L-threonine dehydratase catabolic TdcB n=1 Tax=Mycetomoellerius zeteki TaxID=64791 RepID=UPI00084E5E76|nr:PREDICTED: L-threonine dehydratase catabolic TdcB-like [Trachymyrmex zeteki]
MSPEKNKQKKEKETAMPSMERAIIQSMEVALQPIIDTTIISNVTSFSYTVVRTLKRQEFNFTWNIIEKGFNKSAPGKEYEISYITIKQAASFLNKLIRKTPCFQSERILNGSGFNIYLKKELYQITDSIKARGVVYSLLHLSDEQKCKGVITISSGSFAFTLCHYAFRYEIPVTVVMPTTTTAKRVQMCQDVLLARVLIRGGNLLEAHHAALDIAIREGLFYLDGNDHPNMIIGQATLGIEIMNQQSKIDAVLLPTTIEGCGLTTAIAIAIKGCNSKITVIEVRGTSFDLFQDVKKQTDLLNELNIIRPKEYIVCPLRNMPHSVIDRFISVDPKSIHFASIHLHKNECYYDCYGAIALAAILSGQLDDLHGKR